MEIEYELQPEEREALNELHAEITAARTRHAAELGALEGQANGILRVGLKKRDIRERAWFFAPDGKITRRDAE